MGVSLVGPSTVHQWWILATDDGGKLQSDRQTGPWRHCQRDSMFGIAKISFISDRSLLLELTKVLSIHESYVLVIKLTQCYPYYTLQVIAVLFPNEEYSKEPFLGSEFSQRGKFTHWV